MLNKPSSWPSSPTLELRRERPTLSQAHLFRWATNLGDEGAGDLGLKRPPKSVKSRGEVGLLPAAPSESLTIKKRGMLKRGALLVMGFRSEVSEEESGSASAISK